MISSQNKPKRRGIKKKSLVKSIYGNKRIGNGMERYSSGTGYLIIPSDVNRDDYIKLAYQTGRVILVEDFGNIIKDALVPVHVLKELVFPTTSNQRGSLVSWQNIPVRNQVIVTGILLKSGEMYPYTENEKVDDIGDDVSVAVDTSTPSYTVSVTDSTDNITTDASRIRHSVNSNEGGAYVQIDSRAVSKVYGENMAEMDSETTVRLNVGSEMDAIGGLEIRSDGSFNYTDRNGNYIRVNTEGEITIQGSDIKLGGGAVQSAVLGDELVSLLSTLIRGVLLINPSTPASAIPDIQTALQQVNNITSNLVKVE